MAERLNAAVLKCLQLVSIGSHKCYFIREEWPYGHLFEPVISYTVRNAVRRICFLTNLLTWTRRCRGPLGETQPTLDLATV